ncbi:MAG: hypothetical protein IPG60_06380 [Bacteroidetes bacterium]|nr:hypothetical protein [Bacteroidota bacterium]MBK8488356.1 hypothetical protein [Bacteroidota bacterium]MBK8681880.1 hypothetical protein [Bacteroidota bacterium]MBP9703304.1 hypothetical protein [Chitinophagales bacterium]
MKNKFIVFIATAMVFSLSACDEKVDDTPDPNYDARITIIEPDEGMVMNSGEELHIEVDVEVVGTIHNVEVLALNETTGDTILYYLDMPHTQNLFQFHDHVEPIVTEISNCIVRASSWGMDETALDADSKTVHFTINP